MNLSRALGVPAPRITLRFHPTTDDYERATGQAWFTSGAVVNHELHLLPLAVLRDRGRAGPDDPPRARPRDG